ncbi:MAG: phosphate acyltransferase PlsX [Planctomycetes bacterium]|nr:phosphate acyltransferase PlsX [Planctomycetota bacterium]
MPSARIALDVMGGDKAPDAIVRGALLAVSPKSRQPLPVERILLVGDEALVRAKLAEFGGDPGFAIRHATQVIGMAESPAQALRAKPDSTIVSMTLACKQGEAGAAVSMGNTGAVVGAATLMLGTLPGVKRPGIAVTTALTGKPLTVIDMGANIAPKAEHLVQYGVMGSIYARDCLGQEGARVALLNIGEEEGKGTDLHKEAYKLLQAAPIEFVGNLEGNELLSGKAEVLITDGFTGNVMLKLMEDLAGFMVKLTLKELAQHGVQAPAQALANIKKSIDYSEYGGAPLLGVNGVVIIGHGRSDENAVANALIQAARALDAGMNEDIVAGLQNPGSGAGA